jgi:hypothetical protein
MHFREKLYGKLETEMVLVDLSVKASNSNDDGDNNNNEDDIYIGGNDQ